MTSARVAQRLIIDYQAILLDAYNEAIGTLDPARYHSIVCQTEAGGCLE
jgi:hypothetical protein